MQKSRIEKDLNEENEKIIIKQENSRDAAIVKIKQLDEDSTNSPESIKETRKVSKNSKTRNV